MLKFLSILGEYCREFPFENLGILLDLFAVWISMNFNEVPIEYDQNLNFFCNSMLLKYLAEVQALKACNERRKKVTKGN